MLERLGAVGGQGVCVRQLGGDRAGEIRVTRFLRNPSVDLAEMVAVARDCTRFAAQGRHVLAIQDTTVTRSEGGGGSYLHVMIAVDAADGVVLGALDAQFLQRTGGLGRKSPERGPERGIEAKQSLRWITATANAGAALAGAARITMIADREADIYQLFARRPASVDLVVRAAHDRALADGARLFATVDGWSGCGQVAVDLPARPGQAARQACLTLRFGPVALRHPVHRLRRDTDTAEVQAWLVDLREEHPAPGCKPLHWRLLTSNAVRNVAQAIEIAEIYRKRWLIEEVFRTLKTKGFDIEDLRIADEAPRNKLIFACLIAACTVMQMVRARDGLPDLGMPGASGAIRPLTDAFSADDQPLLEVISRNLEGKTDRQKNPHPPTSLAFATWVMARLGGWTGYYGKPGPIVVLKGWMQFQTLKRGAKLGRMWGRENV